MISSFFKYLSHAAPEENWTKGGSFVNESDHVGPYWNKIENVSPMTQGIFH